MSEMTVTRQFHVHSDARGRKQIRGGSERAGLADRVPRVAKLMALAIRFDELIRDRVLTDQAELARVGRVSLARVTQIMNLLNLAPEIQEQVLQLPLSESGRCAATERDLRPIAAVPNWRTQMRAWSAGKKSQVLELRPSPACLLH